MTVLGKIVSTVSCAANLICEMCVDRVYIFKYICYCLDKRCYFLLSVGIYSVIILFILFTFSNLSATENNSLASIFTWAR